MELSPESLHSPYHPQNLPQNASYEQTARLYWQSLQVPAQEHSSCSDSLNSREKHAPTDPSTYYYTPNSAFSSNASETVLESVNPAETYNSSNSLLSDGHQISYTPTDGVHALSNGPPDSAVSDYHRSLALHHAHHAHVIPSMLAPDYYQPSPHSTYSATPSTPSDFYDEDAENINPNQMPYPTHAPRPMNVLRDSQAYPVPQDDDENGIAAPVPLSYNARSKSVLSAMISPVEHTRPRRLATPPPPPSPAPTTPSYTLNFSYAPELAHYTLAPPRSRIRPITPSTLLALTEPFLMAWCADYRHALIPPPLSSNAAVAAGPVGLMGPGVSVPTWGQPHPSLTGLIQAGGAYFRS